STDLKTEVEFPALSTDVPCTYHSYTYEMAMLGGDNAWAQDLVTQLQAYPTDVNTQILAMIVGDTAHPLPALGSPWKLTHAIEQGAFVVNGSCQTPGAAAPRASSIPKSLVARGIKNDLQVGLLNIALVERAHPPSNLVRKAPKDVVPAEIRALANSLSPQ